MLHLDYTIPHEEVYVHTKVVKSCLFNASCASSGVAEAAFLQRIQSGFLRRIFHRLPPAYIPCHVLYICDVPVIFACAISLWASFSLVPFYVVIISNMSTTQEPPTITMEKKESQVMTKSEESEQNQRQANSVSTEKSAVTPETHRFDPEFTQSVINATGPKASPRMRKVMASLIRHVHDFARENEITVDEYMAGIEMASIALSLHRSHVDTLSLSCLA